MSNNIPLVSIAMATYNGEKYLREQLDSILAQTMQDFELVICDDCSTDGTVEILNGYAEKDSRITFLVNEMNLGFRKNFEKAISLCSGTYIALSDQDDIWLPAHLQILLSQIHGKSCSCGNSIMVDKDNHELGNSLSDVEGLSFFPADGNYLYRVLLSTNALQGASCLYESNFLKKKVPVPDGINFHDAWFSACACMENGIAYTFTPVTRHRQHGQGQITFLAHNSKKTVIKKIRIFLNALTGRRKKYTDRFIYVEELHKIYGDHNTDFTKIRQFVLHIKNKRISVKDIVMLWKNYFFITTEKTHKDFLYRFFLWKSWEYEK